MTTRSHLAQYGVTLTQAHDFIKANLGSPATIYQVAKQFGVDSQKLADIMSIDFPGLSAATVEAFFQGNGLQGSALHNPVSNNASTEPLLSSNLSALSNLVSFNKNTGELSNDAIRAKVSAATGADTYQYTFAAFNFKGAEDGTFSATDLGVNNLTSFPATWQNMESLFYGTVITMMQSIDKTELQTVKTFYKTNQAALDKDDATALAQLRTLVTNMLETPATDPVYPSATLAQDVATQTVEVVKLIGSSQETNLLSALLGSMIGI